MSNEEWYDNEIAPALAELAKRCHERGMAFLAVVEYEPGDRGGTYSVTDHAGLPMHMLYLCARTAPNVDSYIINLEKHCATRGLDTEASMVMRGLRPNT